MRKHLRLTLALTALLGPVVIIIEGIKLTSTIQAQDGEQKNENADSKKIESVLIKTVSAWGRSGVQYEKEFTLTSIDSKYMLTYSCDGQRCDCRRSERIVEQRIAEEFLSDVGSELKASVADRKVPAGLVITYNDMHPLSGGATIVMRGNGRAERRVRLKKESEPRVTHTTISQRELLDLIQLLISLQAWKQHSPSRQPIADESRAMLTISINGHKSESWEWFNEISKNNRLVQVKEKMLALTKKRFTKNRPLGWNANDPVSRQKTGG